MNSTGLDSSWSSASVIYDVPTRAASPSLAACYGGWNGVDLRLFYGVENGTILELHNALDGKTAWASAGSLPNSTAASGIICGASRATGTNQAWMNVFMKNNTDAENVVQLAQSFPDGDAWRAGKRTT